MASIRFTSFAIRVLRHTAGDKVNREALDLSASSIAVTLLARSLIWPSVSAELTLPEGDETAARHPRLSCRKHRLRVREYGRSFSELAPIEKRRQQMRVIYIAGTSHSGSTLLSLMLNANSEFMSVGEIQNLNRQLNSYRRCSCGASSLWECNFWRAVDDYLRWKSGKSLIDLDMLDYSNAKDRFGDNQVLFEAIGRVSGKNFIVDSSKHPRRMAYLMRIRDLNVYPVYLIRTPEGQINSVLKKRGGLVKPILSYELVNIQIRSRLRSVPHSVVHYEDLILKPEATLRTVLEPLGVRYDPKQLRWAEFVAHDVAGNHMRLNKASDLALDESWKRDLRHLQKYAIWCATILSRINNPETGFVHN